MVPTDLNPFLIACIGASASFIGLLFVGLSVVLQKADQKIADADRMMAESSYASLINIFFVCLVAILPRTSIGYVCLVMSIIGLLNCWRLLHFSHVAPLIVSALVYAAELYLAINILVHPHKVLNTSLLETLIVILFGISLGRAWGLTGIRSRENKK